jgi:phosphoribosylamine--glycine ligase
MNVLLIGSGAREHAMAWKIAQSSLLDELYISPGNPGTLRHGRNVELDLDDQDGLCAFLLEKRISIVVVGPEQPLVEGLHDRIADDPRLQGKVCVVGPRKAAARLEGSKDFAKEFMLRHNIPTAAHRTFRSSEEQEAVAHLERMRPPYVIKADGLAAGKGVVITSDAAEAATVIKGMLSGRSFGAAGRSVVLEQHLAGTEVSAFLVTDGRAFKMLPMAKDYKRAGDGDRGPNTGGMGAVSPVPLPDKDLEQKVHDRIAAPTVRGLHKEGIAYQGFLFMGLMVVNGDPYVIEYNVRMGDPETQVVMPRLKSDLLDLLEGISSGTLSERHVDVDDRTAVGVVLAAEGYPGTHVTDKPVLGVEQVQDAYVFQAGTVLKNGVLTTKGGRVMTVTSMGKDLEQAIARTYKALAPVDYEGKFFRTDIGHDLVRSPQKV